MVKIYKIGDGLLGSVYSTPNSFYNNDSYTEALIKTQLTFTL